MEEETKCYCGHTTYCDCGPEEPKQETLEEAAERLHPIANTNNIFIPTKYEIANINRKEGFIKGFKLAQEQIGKSEFLQKLRATKSDAEARRLILEQFKNK